MTIGADFHVDIALMRRPRFKAMAACAHDTNFAVGGMNGCFHDFEPQIKSLDSIE
jgi:hypothetical protein